eukprot:353040-Chlamydomonas_euryale.AAC.2
MAAAIPRSSGQNAADHAAAVSTQTEPGSGTSAEALSRSAEALSGSATSNKVHADSNAPHMRWGPRQSARTGDPRRGLSGDVATIPGHFRRPAMAP